MEAPGQYGRPQTHSVHAASLSQQQNVAVQPTQGRQLDEPWRSAGGRFQGIAGAQPWRMPERNRVEWQLLRRVLADRGRVRQNPVSGRKGVRRVLQSLLDARWLGL